MRKFTLAAILAIIIPFGLSAARLTLRDGSMIYGQFVSGDSRTIVFDDENGARRRFSTNQVQTIDLQAPGYSSSSRDSGGGYSRSSRDSGGYDRNTSYRSYDNNTAYRSYEGAANSDWVSVPAGTQISVRTDQGIYSSNAASGATFPATILHDVMDPSGAMLIPHGSPAQLVMRSDRGGYMLDLDSVQVRGRQYRVDTSDVSVSQQGIGANRRTAEYLGGGAALGTLLGAIAGGGKGAAIGAVAGAAAGGGVQVLTRGHEVRVPPETVLNFRLEQPLALRAMR